MIAAPRPEAQLLLDCARVDPPPTSRERVKALLATDIDWDDFLALAARHGLMPLAYESLEAIAPAAVPKPVTIKLWAARQRTLAQNGEMANELMSILGELDAIGISALPYKGPTLALELYGDVGLRQFGDLDLLLRREDVAHAKERMQARGYVADYPLQPAVERAFVESGAQYHLAMRSPSRGLMVELHWRIDPDVDIEPEKAGAKRFRSRELLLVLLIHGSKHRWSSMGWLVDVAEMMGRDKVDWAWIGARAAALRCERRVALGVLLAAALLQAPLPAELAARYGALPGMQSACEAVARDLLAREPAEATPMARLRENLRLYDTTGQRIKHAFDTVWSPSLVEWSRWPLPRALFFLYPPLRLARLAWKHTLARRRP